MAALLPLMQVVLVTIILFWDIALTGRISQVQGKKLPRPFVFLTALAGFLLLPGLLLHLALSSAITGRSVNAMGWLWPTVLVLFAIQALYAARRRLVNPLLGFSISLYNMVIAGDAVLRYVASRGTALPSAALIYLAATSAAFAVATQSSTIIGSPLFFLVPLTAPAFPALRRASATFRVVLAFGAILWIGLVLSQLTSADKAVASYQLHDTDTEKLQERPASDFDIGLKIFPDLAGPPPPVSIKNDLALTDSLGVTAVSVTVIPELMDRAALDSLAHTLEVLRSDSTQVILTLGYETSVVPFMVRPFSEIKRLRAIGPIVRRLKPDILLPAEDPYDAGTRAAGLHPPQFWESYLKNAAAEAKRADRKVRIGVAASVYDRRDSALYAWAAAPGSPIDVPGFTLYPSASGTLSLDAARRAADGWMRESASTKDHWVFSSGGFPEAHGEASQERAVWDALAWATSRPMIKGLIVSEAGDYGAVRGVRAADGHLRLVAFAIMRALKGLKETAVPDSAPPALKVPRRVGG